jgi:hypothetical protein
VCVCLCACGRVVYRHTDALARMGVHACVDGPHVRGGGGSHAVDNPDMASEMYLLRQYAPSVPEETLRRLTLGAVAIHACTNTLIYTRTYTHIFISPTL